MTPEVDQLVAALRRTPAILEAWFDGLPDAWLLADEGPDTFSPRAVLAHVILGERTDWMPRVRMIRAHGEAQAFEPFDRFGFEELLRVRTTRELLDDFAACAARILPSSPAPSLTTPRSPRAGTIPHSVR